MPRKRRGSRIYWRKQRDGSELRAYADFRDFADVDGRREALIPPGETQATSDPDVAQELVAARLRELKEFRKHRKLVGTRRLTSLGLYANHHLDEMEKHEEATQGWIDQIEKRLDHAIEYFGENRELSSIRPSDVRDYTHHLKTRRNSRGSTMSDGTVRHYLNALSGLYSRAQEDEVVLVGYNPVAALSKKPTGRPKQRKIEWLEPHEAALYLEAARLYDLRDGEGRLRFAYPLVATFLLTGALHDAVLGLEVGDVSFDRGTVNFYANRWRRLKTEHRHRTMPLWPQLREILQEYLLEREGPPHADRQLLFPNPRTGKMLTDIRKTLDAIAELAGWEKGQIRTKLFRKTYCSARLQTLDNGAPVSEFTVVREMGHSSPTMVRQIYGQLGTIRHRAEVMEYRVEQHEDLLGERLKSLRGLR